MLLAAALAAGCTPAELSECRQVRLSFSDMAVRTSLNPERTLLRWCEGDAVSVYNDVDGSIATAAYQAGGNIGVSVPVAATRLKATYPETAGSYANPGFVFPAVQSQTAAGVLNGVNYPLVAEAEIVNDAAALQFRSVGSAFALNIYNPMEAGEQLQRVSVKPAQRSKAIQVNLETPFEIGADKPADKRTYEGQVYVCLEKGQYNKIAFTVRTDKRQYSITSNETVMDLEQYEFLAVNLDLAHLKAYVYFEAGCEGFTLDEAVDVTFPEAGFVDLVELLPDAQITEDEIPDFSTVGYHWGEDDFPDFGTTVQLAAPSGGDDTPMIQAAIDAASEGTVIQFAKGRYIVDSLLIVDKNGIILRGHGNRETEIFARGTVPLDKVDPKSSAYRYAPVRPLINVGVSKTNAQGARTAQVSYSIAAITVNNLSGRRIEEHEDAWTIRGTRMYSAFTESLGTGSPIEEDAFCGSRFVTVHDASSFNVGDKVVIWRPGTQAWIRAIKMDMIIKALDDIGKIYQWSPNDYTMRWERTVKAIVADRLYLDTPLVMSVTQEFGGGSVLHCNQKRIHECGIENLLLTSDYNPDRDYLSGGVTYHGDPYHATSAIVFYGAEHCWVRNVEMRRFCESAVEMSAGAKNITVLDCVQKEATGYLTGGLRYAFHISSGQQCLVRNCTTDDDRHQFATGARIPGPNVFSRCTSTNGHSDVGPHQRWATGTLYDNVSTNASMKAIDAGNSGTGHGWQGTNQVFWCCTASKFAAQTPWVTGKNYVIGCTFPGGAPATLSNARNYPNPGYAPDGVTVVYDSEVNGTRISGVCRPLEPGEEQSLYEAQLRIRLAAGDRVSNYVSL